MNVLVCMPLDQDLQRDLVKELAQLEQIKKAKVTLLHVFKQENYAYMVPPYIYPNAPQREEIAEFTCKMLKDLGEQFESGDQSYQCLFEENPKKGAIELIKAEKPDLVITATRGKHGIEGLFSSSFTEYLVKFCPTPVLVLRGKSS